MGIISRLSWKPWFEERLAYRGSIVRGDRCEDPPHPLRHISAVQCHEWMLRDCAALELARQQREDSVVASVTTISSAALLAIPGLLLGKDIRPPPLVDGFALYFGFFAFSGALGLAILEQVWSSSAYKKHAVITQAFYRLKSNDAQDEKIVKRVNRARVACLLVFAIALTSSAIGLSQIGSNANGKSTTSTAATSATSAAAAATTSASASASAANWRSGECPEINPGRCPAGTPKAMKPK